MLHDLYGFLKKPAYRQKKTFNGEKRHLSIAFAANIICTYLRSSKSIDI